MVAHLYNQFNTADVLRQSWYGKLRGRRCGGDSAQRDVYVSRWYAVFASRRLDEGWTSEWMIIRGHLNAKVMCQWVIGCQARRSDWGQVEVMSKWSAKIRE
jgi:hypothetical protein